MKKSSRTDAEIRPCDTDTMVAAIRTLQAAGVIFERPTGHQIKVGTWNFYPARGKIFQDGCGTKKERGVEAFIGFLLADGHHVEKIPTKRNQPFQPFVIK